MEVAEKREYFRIKDRLPVEFRAISHEEFLALEDKIKYNPSEIVDKTREMYFLKEMVVEEEKEKNQTYAYFRIIERKLDTLIDLLDKTRECSLYHHSHSGVELSGSGIRFMSDILLDEGQYIELKVILPVFPYPKIGTLSQVSRREDSETKGCTVVAKFLVINEENRDLLIHYIFRKERECIRLRKELSSG